mgnify:CR=1 FL=1
MILNGCLDMQFCPVPFHSREADAAGCGLQRQELSGFYDLIADGGGKGR